MSWMNREIASMMLIYFADVVVTCVVLWVEHHVGRELETKDTDGISYYNYHISRIIFWINIGALFSSLLTGVYFGFIGKENIKHNADVQHGGTIQYCKKRTRYRYLSLLGKKKLLAIVVSALGYLGIPYLMAMAQVHVWTVAQVVYKEAVIGRVNLVNRMTYAVFGLRVAEIVIGHAWAVARTECLTSEEKKAKGDAAFQSLNLVSP